MGKHARSRINLTLSVSILLLIASACALTVKQSVLFLRRDWDTTREAILIALDQDKLPKEAKKDFIAADALFNKVYNKVKDRLLNNGDVTETDLKLLNDLIEVWKARVPK